MPSLGYGRDVELLADEQGNVHLIWNSTNGIFYRRWTSAQGWEPATEITHDVHKDGNFDMATDANGLVHVVIAQKRSGVRYVQQQADGTWSTPRLVTDDYKVRAMRIAVDKQGNRHIVWSSYENDPSSNDLYYAILP